MSRLTTKFNFNQGNYLNHRKEHSKPSSESVSEEFSAGKIPCEDFLSKQKAADEISKSLGNPRTFLSKKKQTIRNLMQLDYVINDDNDPLFSFKTN